MNDLVTLSALFGWPLAAFSLIRMSGFSRCTSSLMRWGYALVLLGALFQAASPWVLTRDGGDVLAARWLIVGLMLLSSGLGVLLGAYRSHRHRPH